jgi:PAS domain S-box-containing protein
MIVDANRAAESLTGRSIAELRSLHHTELHTPERAASDPRSFEKNAEVLALTEGMILHKDGRRIPVEVSPSHFVAPDGRRILISVFRDISERLAAREVLRQSERVYRAIGESIDYGVWVCAPDGRNTYASESFLKLVGQTQEEYSNSGWANVLHPDDAERTIAGWKECVRTEGRWDIEHRFRGVDGEWHPILSRGGPVRDEEGRITCWAGINLDVSRLKRTEESLRESEAQARAQTIERQALMDAVPAGIFIANDPECRSITGNRRAYELLRQRPGGNLSKSAPAEQSPSNFRVMRDGVEIPPEELPIQVAARTGQPVRSCELHVAFDDGACVDLFVTAEPLLGDDGEPRGAVAVLSDITDRKREELELRKFLSLADNSGDFIGICDMNLMPFYVNQAALQLVGLDNFNHALRTPVAEFFFPEDRRFVTEEFFPRVIREGRAEVEIRFRHFRTGKPVWMIYNVFYIKDAKGQAIGLATVSRDITERMRAEATLRQSEQRLKSAERIANVGHWDWDINTNQVTWSEGTFRIFGRPPDYQASYEDLIRVTIPEDRGRLEKVVRDSLAENHGFVIEFRIARPDGDVRTVRSISEISLDEGSVLPLRMFGTVQDITDEKRAQEESFARQKLETVGTLAGGIAHDFNNLLGAVLGQAELAMAELETGSVPEEELKTIRAVAIRGSEIVRQLMIYAGTESEITGPVDLSRTVAEMVDLLKVSVSKRATLAMDLARDLPALHANVAQIRRLVMNLVTNASQAIGDREGVIRVATRHLTVTGAVALSKRVTEGDYLELEVSDNGCGMSQDMQSKVFDPFFTTKSTGRGLGLAVVQGVVRNLGGTINLASELGKGTTFQILLPCVQAAAKRTADPLRGSREPLRESLGATVLIVEDEDALRQAVVKFLRRTGAEVLEAAKGSTAIELLREHSGDIDVILLDLTIPGASAQEILAEAAQARPNSKVILTSAYSEEKAAGMEGPNVRTFIRKPFKLGDLTQTLRKVLSS